jgi:heme exporter protein A
VLQSLLAEAHANGRTIVLSTHQLREALEIATHVALIRRGQLVFSGERTQQMLDDTGWLYRTYGDN